MTDKQYYKTGEKHQTNDYPYGYTLRTTRFEWVEFNPKRGYRSVTQTINPKTRALNKPKKNTYSMLDILSVEDGRVKFEGREFYKDEEYNEICDYIVSHADLLSPQEIEYLYIRAISFIKITAYSQMQYCGSKWEEIKPVIESALNPLLGGLKAKTIDGFKNSRLDYEALEKAKAPGYRPFKVVSHAV